MRTRHRVPGGFLLALVWAAPLHAHPWSGAAEGPGPSAAADTVTAWFAALGYGREFLRSDLPQWTDWTRSHASLVRDFGAVSLGGELHRVERFGAVDEGGSLDGYIDLGDRAYGNLRLRVTTGAEVLPRWDARAEFFQGLPGGWEVSGSYWRMDFETDPVDLVGAGVARYVGSWYLRQVAFVSRLAGASAVSGAFTARRFLAPPHEFLEFGAGLGREVVVFGAGPTVDTRDTRFLQARMQRFVSHRWGVALGLAYNDFEGAPGRSGLSLGLLTRF